MNTDVSASPRVTMGGRRSCPATEHAVPLVILDLLGAEPSAEQSRLHLSNEGEDSKIATLRPADHPP